MIYQKIKELFESSVERICSDVSEYYDILYIGLHKYLYHYNSLKGR